MEVLRDFSVITQNIILTQNLLLICLKKEISLNHWKRFTSNIAKKIELSVYGGIIRKNINEEYNCVTETWLRKTFDDRVKQKFLLKNGSLKEKLKADEGVDDYHKAKSINAKPSHFGNYILPHSQRLMSDVIQQKGGFYTISIYYTDTDSVYIHKKYWSHVVDNGFFGMSLGLGKFNYGTSGIFFAWFLAPKIKYCSVIDDFVVFWLKELSRVVAKNIG